MMIPLGLLILVLILLFVEGAVVRNRANRLPIRIHVNGTRGKSSVTRYIAAGLRAGGRKTLAKVTGITPTLILPDGSTTSVVRRGGARVQEQFKTILRASREGADALVLECMSIRPELQSVESRVLKPHVYLLTNVLDDHREELGNNKDQQIEALCGAMAPGSMVITAPGAHVEALKARADRLGNRVSVVAELPAEQLDKLPEGVFPVNVALALAACEASGVTSGIAYPAIVAEAARASRPDVFAIDRGVPFVNGFAVNDVPSAEQFIAYWRPRYPETTQLTVVFNARSDRPLRSVLFSKFLPTVKDLTHIVVIGSHAPYMRRSLISAGCPRGTVVSWTHRQIRNSRQELAQLGISPQHLVMGLGNIGGDGHLLLAALRAGSADAV